MKKTLLILSLSLLLSACGNNEWDRADPEMPEDLRELNETILNEQLGFLEEDPENLDALFEVAFRYQQLGDWRKAVEYYEKVLELAETDWASLNNLAYIYEEVGDYETAAEYIKTLYMADPGSIEVIKDTVRILLEAGDAFSAEEALQNFEKLSIDPASPNPDMQALIDKLYNDIRTWKEENGSSATN